MRNRFIPELRVKLKAKTPKAMEQTNKNLRILENPQIISNFERFIRILCLLSRKNYELFPITWLH